MKPRRILCQFSVVAALAVSIPFGLVLSDWPEGDQKTQSTLDFSGLASTHENVPNPVAVTMRDGYELQVRDYGHKPGPLVILVHGSGWNGLQFSHLAPHVPGHVLAIDLRGHGAKPGMRGDVAYIGQLEDDLADLIADQRKPGQKVALVGHSSGGGLVVRFAGGEHGNLVDQAVLLAPFLKYNAPTTRKNSGGWARPLTRRIIGLSMLNRLGFTFLNSLTAIEFDMPELVLEGPLGHLATTAYSYRLNVSYAPRVDYLADIAALPPFLLIAGEQDEAFVAAEYEPLMGSVTPRGRYVLVPDTSHLAIVDAPETAAEIRSFLGGI